jgi:hypothetical protein
VLQDASLGPVQAAPPFCGAGFVHERVKIPVPQAAEQALYGVQPPLTGVGPGLGLPPQPTDGAKPSRELPTSKTVMNVFMKLQPRIVWLEGAIPEQKSVRPVESCACKRYELIAGAESVKLPPAPSENVKVMRGRFAFRVAID